MFDRDVRHYRATPRTLQSSKFGAYSVISIPTRRSRVMSAVWMVLYGMAIGAVWYLCVALRSGS